MQFISYDGKAEFSAAVTPVFSGHLILIFGNILIIKYQVIFLIINVETVVLLNIFWGNCDTFISGLL